LKNVIVSIQIQKFAIFDSGRKNNQCNSKQIIQILQPIIIDFFSMHSYIVDIFDFLKFVFRLQLFYTAGAGVSKIPGK